jgi:hypothetical protein
VRLARVRFTVRWMMVAVMVAAVGLGMLAWVGRRTAAFRDRAERLGVQWMRLNYVSSTPRIERLKIHCAALRQKYDRALRYPFLPVPPDPPEPE